MKCTFVLKEKKYLILRGSQWCFIASENKEIFVFYIFDRAAATFLWGDICLFGVNFVTLHVNSTTNESTMIEDLVSVIMPTYNASKFLADSIEGVLLQTYPQLELLITDDCSSDEATRQILKYYQKKDSRVNVVFLKDNHGPGYARNQSIQRAKGRYIAFCDSDDKWFPDKLEKQIAFIKEKGCCLVFSSYYRCSENGEIIGYVNAPSRLTLKSLKHDNKIGCLTAMYDAKPYGKFYMPELRKRQDWALFLSILKESHVAYALKMPLALYRKTPYSISRQKTSLIKYNAQVYRMVFGYSKSKAYWYLYTIFLPSYATKKLQNKLYSFVKPLPKLHP